MFISKELLDNAFSPNRTDTSAQNLVGFRLLGSRFSGYRFRRFGTGLAKGTTVRRSAIRAFSDMSRKRMQQSLQSAKWHFVIKQFLTVTYPADFPTNGREFKTHYKRLMDAIQYRYPDIRIFWFLEFQKRGAPHIHAYLTETVDYHEMRELWDNASFGAGGFIWQVAPTKYMCENPDRYASKYSAKLEQKIIPDGIENPGRFWGWRNPPHLIDVRILFDIDLLKTDDLAKYWHLVDFLQGDGFHSTSIPYIDQFFCVDVPLRSICEDINEAVFSRLSLAEVDWAFQESAEWDEWDRIDDEVEMFEYCGVLYLA